uniref:Uncharacterized protein n=1 Tax=Cacopsylla melanoneura TaxID=428564 RepID=A0A8D8RAN9_9HEMI
MMPRIPAGVLKIEPASRGGIIRIAKQTPHLRIGDIGDAVDEVHARDLYQKMSYQMTPLPNNHLVEKLEEDRFEIVNKLCVTIEQYWLLFCNVFFLFSWVMTLLCQMCLILAPFGMFTFLALSGVVN